MLRYESLESRVYLHGEGFFPAGHEQVPDYVHEPDTVSVRDGDWFDEATWSNGVPDLTDDVRIDHDVSIGARRLRSDVDQNGAVDINDAMAWLSAFRFQSSSNPFADIDGNGTIDSADASLLMFDWFNPQETASEAVAEDILVNGSLSFRPDVDTRLEVQTLTIMGRLEVGREDAPIVASAEIVFRDAPIDVSFDPEQFGHGLLVLGSGEFETNGRDRTPFVELSSARFGSETITLASEVSGWVAGDEIFLPDTRMLESHDFSQAETVRILAIEGREVILTQPLRFSHDGADGNLPHAAYLGGNIVFRSENPDGVRGHILVNDRAVLDVRDAVFADLGRTTIDQLDNAQLDSEHNALHVGTNQTGRYAFHIHHLYGSTTPSDYQYRFGNNVIRNSEKWGLAIHDSHFGLINDNVVVDAKGAGIVFEDGSEFGNSLDHNFIGLVPGSGLGVQGRANGQEPRPAGDGSPGNPFRTIGDLGHEGAGIWARGISNDISNNVIANVRMGTVLWSRFQPTEPIPAFRGADTHTDYVLVPRGQQLGHAFQNNEFYGMSLVANWQGLAQEVAGSQFVVTDMVTWNVGTVIDSSYTGALQFNGGSFHGRDRFATQIGFTDFIGLDGVRVVGFRQGVQISLGGNIVNSFFDCTREDIVVLYEKTSPAQRQIVIDSVKFGDDRTNIVYKLGDTFNKRTYTSPLDVIVRNYNQVAGDDFQIWLPEQSADYVMPTSEKSRFSPAAGLTNQQLWEKYRLTLAGKLLPSTADERDGIGGLVTPIGNDLVGPTISNVVVSTQGTTATVTWRTDEPASSQLEWELGELRIDHYSHLLSANPELKTEHQATITGLIPGKKYSFLIRVFDDGGNLGGNAKLDGLKYRALTFVAG